MVDETDDEFVRTKTFFKGPRVPQKVQTRRRRDARDATERDHKAEVRRRDRRCRWPRCACRSYPVVAHGEHKGMGGDKTGERSLPHKMMLLCSPRHRESRYSVDGGELDWRELTALGTAGPCSFHILVRELPARFREVAEVYAVDGWLELARETAIGEIGPLEFHQAAILAYLANLEA